MEMKKAAYLTSRPLADQIVQHYHTSTSKGSVTIKLERNSKGLNWEIRIDKPIEESAINTGTDILCEIAAVEAGITEFASKYALKTGDKVVIENGLQSCTQ